MRYKYLVILMVSVVLFSCKKEKETVDPKVPPTGPGTPVPTGLLKDIVIPNLPSPYYHFEYNTAGKPIFVFFASGFNMYDIRYNGNRISEMQNTIIVNKDRLQYGYDTEGRVNVINYFNEDGIIYRILHFTYAGDKLIKLVRERQSGIGYVTDKTMTMLYHDDGNLFELTDHRPAIPQINQPEFNTVDRFEGYDNKMNVDGFSLLHNEFFQHMIFLPEAPLQKNNPAKITHTGSGANYRIDYVYTYNNNGLPTAKDGIGVWSTGPNAGQHFNSNSVYSYY